MKGLTIHREERPTEPGSREKTVVLTGDFHFQARVTFKVWNGNDRGMEPLLTQELEHKILSELLNVVAQESESKVYCTARIQEDKIVTVCHPRLYHQALTQQATLYNEDRLNALRIEVIQQIQKLEDLMVGRARQQHMAELYFHR